MRKNLGKRSGFEFTKLNVEYNEYVGGVPVARVPCHRVFFAHVFTMINDCFSSFASL